MEVAGVMQGSAIEVTSPYRVAASAVPALRSTMIVSATIAVPPAFASAGR
jgi:hypothetical protein